MTKQVSNSTIIAAFFWPQTTADLALVLRMRPRHIQAIWTAAKDEGELPNIMRPRQGFHAKELAALIKEKVA
jgi:hypothetical protein